MGDRGEPCGTPAGIGISSDSWPSKNSVVDLLDRKLRIQLIVHIGTLNARRLARSLLWSTESKAPEISSDRRVAAPPCFQAVRTRSVSSRKAVSVERPFRLPIYSSGSSPFSSAKLASRCASRLSITFPMVLSRAIGLHPPAWWYSLGCFPGFRRITVTAFRNALG